jgi:hypothetical protein
MGKNNLEKEILKMRSLIYQRVREIKRKRIIGHLKKFQIRKSIKMFGSWFSTKKLK